MRGGRRELVGLGGRRPENWVVSGRREERKWSAAADGDRGAETRRRLGFYFFFFFIVETFGLFFFFSFYYRGDVWALLPIRGGRIPAIPLAGSSAHAPS